MSPEQCRGLSSIDHRADIYSLGCVLFVCLTGRPPFEGEGVGDILFAHMGTPAPMPSRFVRLPPVVDQIALRCMAKDPAERFQSMGELAAAMADAAPQLAQRPASVAKSIPVVPMNAPTTFTSVAAESIRPPSPRSRAPLFAVVGLVVIGLVVTGVVAKSGGKDTSSSKHGATPVENTNPIVNSTATSTPTVTQPPVPIPTATPTVNDEPVVDARTAVVNAKETLTDAAVTPATKTVPKVPPPYKGKTKQKPGQPVIDRGD
jgi:eukaryotic-like serine/threonine-protein kinase